MKIFGRQHFYCSLGETILSEGYNSVGGPAVDKWHLLKALGNLILLSLSGSLKYFKEKYLQAWCMC